MVHENRCSLWWRPMLKTFAYRLYPSKPQARLLESTLETCRRWYNQCLAQRRDAYQQRGKSVGKYQQLALIKEQKAINPYAKGIHSHVLQIVVTDLDKAFQAFFRRVKAGETPGFPRFKGRNRFSSFGFKEYGNGFKIDGRRLRLSGIGRIAIRWHRPLEGTIKTVRMSKAAEAGRLVLLVEPRLTSKTCSQCGHIFESLSLADRWIDCRCGLSLDRDHNAAINILKRAGQVRWGISSPVGGLPGCPLGQAAPF